MSLTQQFIFVSFLPAGFLLLVFFSLGLRTVRPRVFLLWLCTLLTAAVWAGSALSYYGGRSFTTEIAFTWRAIGHQALSLLPLWLLFTTCTHLKIQTSQVRVARWILVGLWLLSAALHPGWPFYTIPDLEVGGTEIRHAHIWNAVWVTSWLIPSALAWLLAQRAVRHISGPLYRNQVNYWLMSLTLFAIGGGLGLVRELVLHQFGALVAVLAALVGAVSLVRSKLPDLQLATRRALSRLLGSLIIFGLCWLALSYLTEGTVSVVNPETLFPAAIFAVLITVVYGMVNYISTRLFLPGSTGPAFMLLEDDNVVSSLLEPEAVSQLILKLVHVHLRVEDAWIMLAEEGPTGSILFRPLANQKEVILNPVMFPATSPFIRHLRLDGSPLTQYDIDTHPNFDSLIDQERTIIQRWQRMAYVPLRVGQHITGLLAVGEKGFDEPYSRQDFETLQNIAAQVSPFLAQARQINNLHQLNKFVFQQNQVLVRDKRYLWELVALNNKFLDFISPELREPLAAIERELRTAQEPTFEEKFRLEHERAFEPKSPAVAAPPINPHDDKKLEALVNDTARVKGLINDLINAVARVEKQNRFSYELVHVDEVVRQAVRNLSAMAEARRVHVELAMAGNLRPVFADQEKVVEAVQHLLHNAIKFNKIGGQVRIEYSSDGQEMVIDVIDNGVGIPAERLDTIWDGISRVDYKGTGNAKHLGMGLILTQFIVRAHGGRIDVHSKHGAGSTFSIYLPAALEED